jgi:O-antigen/teichoic acid export membrane protein
MSFKNNVFSVGINNLIITALSLFSSVIIARTLGPEKQGIFAILFVVPSIINTFIGFGTQTATSYFINYRKENILKVFNHVFSFVVIIGFVVFFFLVSLYRPLFVDYSMFGISSSLFFGFFTAFYVLLSYLKNNLVGLFYAIEEYKITNKVNLLANTIPLFIILILWFMEAMSLEIMLIIYLAIEYIILIFLAIIFKNNKKMPYFSLDFKFLIQFIKYGVPIYLMAIIRILQQKVGILLVSRYLGMESVGFFSVSSSIGERVSYISKPIVVVGFPKTNKMNLKSMKSGGDFTAKTISFLSGFFLISLPFYFIVIILLVPVFYSEIYKPVVFPSIILATASAIFSLSQVINNFLASAKFQYYNSFLRGIGLLISFFASYFLIKKGFGINGVAAALLFANIVILFIQIIIMTVFFKIKLKSFIPEFLLTKKYLVYFKNLLLKK